MRVIGDKNFMSLVASTIVLLGVRLKKTAMSPNCKSASIMPTGSPLFCARLKAKFAMSVVLPLLPFGLKKASDFEPKAMPLLPKVPTASTSSSLEKGLIRYPFAPAFTTSEAPSLSQ